MTADQIVAFVIFAAVAAGTPGPSNVMLAAVGANVGLLRGLPSLFGVAAGMGALIFTAALGLGGLLLNWPVAIPAMKAAGTLFLLYLAWKLAGSNAAPKSSDATGIGFWQAGAFQWVNPKAWLAGIGAAAASLTAQRENIFTESLMLGAVFAVTALVVCIPWLGFGSLIRNYLSDPRSRRVFNFSMGGLLAASAVMFWI